MYDTTNISKQIGTAIRDRRKQLGMTQRDVAEIAGLQRQTISRVEAGIEAATFSTVACIAAVVGLKLGVTPRYEDGRR